MSRILRSTASTNWHNRGEQYPRQFIVTPTVSGSRLTIDRASAPPIRRAMSSIMGGGSFPLGYGFPLLSAHANPAGVHRNYAIEGVTRDTNSAALGTVVVQLFRTSDNSFIEQSTSDANGTYQLSTPYSDAHYIVAYKAGSPDVAGTTVDTLTGS